MIRPRRLALALAALAAAACARASQQAQSPAATAEQVPIADTTATTVRVQNQSFLDANIYVVYGGTRYRIGTVTGNSTGVLRIPPSYVRALQPLRFIASPIGGRAREVSEEVTVSPGDEVGLLIPP